MQYHKELIERALGSPVPSFIEIEYDSPSILQLRIDNLTTDQIKSELKRLNHIKRIGLVSTSVEKDKETEEPFKLVTSYGEHEELVCSIVYSNKEIERVSYVSNSIIDFLLDLDKKNSTIH